jgi:prepilin-type N-terminal cleavage/methylation domain-containing protein
MKKKGFTLIELMIAVAIFSIFIIYVYNSFSREQKFFIFTQRAIDLQYDRNTALSYLSEALRNNANMEFSPQNDKIIFSDTAHTKELINLTGNSTNGDINFSSARKSLIDSAGNTLCSNIEEVTLAPDNVNKEIITIKVRQSSGSAQTTVNLRK